MTVSGVRIIYDRADATSLQSQAGIGQEACPWCSSSGRRIFSSRRRLPFARFEKVKANGGQEKAGPESQVDGHEIACDLLPMCELAAHGERT